MGCFESLASVSSNRQRHLYSVDFPTPFLCANSSTFSLLSDQALSSLSFMSTEARFTILFVLGVMRPRLFAPQHPRTGLPVKGLRNDSHRYNKAVVSLRPLIAHLLFRTAEISGTLVDAFTEEVRFPAPLAPDYEVFLRGYHEEHILPLGGISNGENVWWAGTLDTIGAV